MARIVFGATKCRRLSQADVGGDRDRRQVQHQARARIVELARYYDGIDFSAIGL